MTKWRRFACWMGWHWPSRVRGYDGCNVSSTCKGCGEFIMQDSQGNWF